MCDLARVRVCAQRLLADEAPDAPASSPCAPHPADGSPDAAAAPWDQEMYDRAKSTFPANPSRHNTTPAQNFLGLVANVYKAHHEDGTAPQAALGDLSGLYDLSWLRTPANRELNQRLYEYLADAPGIERRLDRLMGLAIGCVCARASPAYMSLRLTLLAFCDI